MANLVFNHDFTSVSENDQKIGCVFDWFEVRVFSKPDILELSKLGYSQILDKGCPTHENYFETPAYSLAWNIRKKNIQQGWTHIRLKNEVFYTDCGCKNLVEYVKTIVGKLFSHDVDVEKDIMVCRLDYAFDMEINKEIYYNLHQKFSERCLTDRIEKYTEFVGNIGNLRYVNYSAGCRSGREFYRFYHKTVENTDYRTHESKKQYIDDWHRALFGKDKQIIRFEIEVKPQQMILSDDVYSNFVLYASKFFDCEDVKLFLGENYGINDYIFTKKDVKSLQKLLSKFREYFKDDECTPLVDFTLHRLLELIDLYYVRESRKS